MGPRSKKALDELKADQEKGKREREQAIEEQKQFVDYEIHRNEEKIKSDARQSEQRFNQLKNSLNKFSTFTDLMLDEELQEKHLREWNLYIKDNRLPNPPVVPEMNTYLHRWHADNDTYELKNIPAKTDEVLSLLNILEEFINYPLGANNQLIENWKEVHVKFCSELQHHFDVGTYRLLRFVEDNLTHKDLNEYNYYMEASKFKLYIWTMLPLPKPMVSPALTPQQCNFDEIGVSVTLPAYLMKIDLVVRGLYVSYDHFSNLCHSSKPVPLPEEMMRDMAETADYEKNCMIKIQSQQVNLRLEKLNLLRNALIALATAYSVEILEAERMELKGVKEKERKSVRKKNKNEDERERARQYLEEQIQTLMYELEIDSLSRLAVPAPKPVIFVGHKEEEESSKKSVGSKESKGSRASRRASKRSGPEKEFWRILEKIKNIPSAKSASELLSEQQDVLDADAREKLCIRTVPGELNLRKYAIVGGVIRVDLYLLLPPPYQHPEKYLLSLIKLPKGLEEVPEKDLEPVIEIKKIERPSVAPRMSTIRQISQMFSSLLLVEQKDEPEEDKEADSKRSSAEGRKSTDEKKSSKKEKKSSKAPGPKVSITHPTSLRRRSTIETSESERRLFRMSSMLELPEEETEDVLYTKLIVKLKDDVMYFEQPLVVLWDEHDLCWSNTHVVHVQAEEQEISFELRRFGPLAFATFRYSNLPFRSWDMRPCHEDNSVQLFIRAKHINITFKIKGKEVCLAKVEKLPKNRKRVLEDIIGIYKRPRELIQIMRSKGLDVFPDYDAYCFLHCHPKFSVLEDHLYHCMAAVSGVYNFLWSRWNLRTGLRKIVILMREFIDRWHPIPTSTLLVTPLKTCLLDCTEWSSDYKEEFTSGSKFYADLYQLLQDTMPLHVLKKVKTMTYAQIETVYEMLTRTKVISYTTTYPEAPRVEFVSYQVHPDEEHKKGKEKKKDIKIKED